MTHKNIYMYKDIGSYQCKYKHIKFFDMAILDISDLVTIFLHRYTFEPLNLQIVPEQLTSSNKSFLCFQVKDAEAFTFYVKRKKKKRNIK